MSKNSGRDNDRQDNRDISSDKSFMWRFIANFVASIANTLGVAGYDVDLVRKALETLEKVFGQSLTNLGITGLAALVQRPDWLKNLVTKVGFPSQVNSLIDEAIDDVFQGLSMAYLNRGRRLFASDEADAQTKIKQLLDKGLHEADYERSFMRLPDNERAKLDGAISAMNPEQTKRWLAFRPNLKGVRALECLTATLKSNYQKSGDALKQINEANAASLLTYLERHCQPVKPSAAASALSSIKDSVKNALGALKKKLPSSLEEINNMAGEMRVQQRMREREQLLKYFPDAFTHVPEADIVARADQDHTILVTAYRSLRPQAKPR